MSNATVSADGGAMPAEGHKTRRALLSLFGAVPALAILPAEAAAGDDSEIVSLGSEILSRCGVAAEFQANRIEPFEEGFHARIRRDPFNVKECWAEACAYSRETGRDDAIKEHSAYETETDGLYYRMMAIPSATQAGRAAKVRALLLHVLREGWLGPAKELDWEKEQARALLAEFAGMSAEEIADV